MSSRSILNYILNHWDFVAYRQAGWRRARRGIVSGEMKLVLSSLQARRWDIIWWPSPGFRAPSWTTSLTKNAVTLVEIVHEWVLLTNQIACQHSDTSSQKTWLQVTSRSHRLTCARLGLELKFNQRPHLSKNNQNKQTLPLCKQTNPATVLYTSSSELQRYVLSQSQVGAKSI